MGLTGTLTLISLLLVVAYIYLFFTNTSLALRIAGGIFSGIFRIAKLLFNGLVALTTGIFRMIRGK